MTAQDLFATIQKDDEERLIKTVLLAFVGTYTRGREEGIFIFGVETDTGQLTQINTVSGVQNPSFLAVHPTGRFLYAVNEVGGKGEDGAVSAFSIDEGSSDLRILNQQSSRGPGPCHLSVDHSGKNVLVANYQGGSLAVLPVREDGSLGEATCFIQHKGSSVNPTRQAGPHAHSINLDPTGRFALAADLGLDKVLVYRFDSGSGTLRSASIPSVSMAPGAGPRHLGVHPSGKWIFVINELASTITVLACDLSSGRFSEVQTISTLPQGFIGRNSTAEVAVSPSGRFVYGSNRGHNSLAVFRIDPQSGRLSLVEHESTQGDTPRNFGITPNGQLLIAANQRSDSLVVFRIDQESGVLTPTGSSHSVPSPVCVRFLRIRN
jgi:6-phosphogluconolactonase